LTVLQQAVEKDFRARTVSRRAIQRFERPDKKIATETRRPPWPPSERSPSPRGNGLEREAEHHLRDAHEPGLDARLAEVRVAEVVAAAQRTHVRTVQKVEHLDLQLRGL